MFLVLCAREEEERNLRERLDAKNPYLRAQRKQSIQIKSLRPSKLTESRRKPLVSREGSGSRNVAGEVLSRLGGGGSGLLSREQTMEEVRRLMEEFALQFGEGGGGERGWNEEERGRGEGMRRQDGHSFSALAVSSDEEEDDDDEEDEEDEESEEEQRKKIKKAMLKLKPTLLGKSEEDILVELLSFGIRFSD